MPAYEIVTSLPSFVPACIVPVRGSSNDYLRRRQGAANVGIAEVGFCTVVAACLNTSDGRPKSTKVMCVVRADIEEMAGKD